MNDGATALLSSAFSVKGLQYASHYFLLVAKPWYFKKRLKRLEIVIVNRIRSNHYNLNYFLHRKNIVDSPACPCDYQRQDITLFFTVSLYTRAKSKNLLIYVWKASASYNHNIFHLSKNLPSKLCRLLLSFLKSINMIV